MPTFTFPLSPVWNQGISSGDLFTQAEKDTFAVDPEQFFNHVGQYNVSKTISEYCMWTRHEIPWEVGAKIRGVRWTGYASGDAGQIFVFLSGGFLKPQNNGNDWEDPNGFYNWTDRNDTAIAQWNNGLGNDLTVFHGDQVGFPGTVVSLETTQFELWSIGEGTLPGNAAIVTGLMAQLQSYLEDNEGYRGQGVGSDSIPVCLHLFSPYLPDNPNAWQALYTESFGTPPFLEVDWVADGVGNIEGHATLAPLVSGRGGISRKVQAASSVGPLVSATTRLDKAIQGRATAARLVDGKGGIT